MINNLKTIPLNDFHLKKGAKLIPFAGYKMPINYKSGIINEHKHVRKKSGIFDVSHMGQILIYANNDNILKLRKFIPLDINNLRVNKSYYSFLLNNKGGIIDDIIISFLNINNNKYFYIVYNSSRKNVDEKIFSDNLINFNIMNSNCLFALQGPLSYEILSNEINIPNNMNFLDIQIIPYNNNNIIISRSGYTGEDGFELSIPNKLAQEFLQKLLINEDCILCGIGSRDSLRIEAGLSLYGNELNENITPIDANLLWALDINRINSNDLNGNENLKLQLKSSNKLNKIGISAINKIILRKDMELLDEKNKIIGKITSGCYSPVLCKSIAIAYIDKDFDFKNSFYCDIRNKLEPINYVKLPFIKKKYMKG